MQNALLPKPSLEDIFEASPTGQLVCQAVRDSAGQIVDFQGIFVNEKAASLLGIPREAFLSGTMLATQPGARESGLFDLYAAITEGLAGPSESELFLNGRWYGGSAVKLGDGFMVTFQGIDEAKAALRREEEARTLLQGVLDATPLAINHLEAVLNEAGEPVDFVFRVVNPASERIGRQPARELIGRRLTERYPNVRETGVFDQYVRVWKTGQSWRAELPYEGDGLTGWFSFLVTRHGNGMVTVINDITDRKQAELEVQRQAETFNGIINSTLNGLIHWLAVRDDAGKITDLRASVFNQAGCDMAGVTPEQFRTRSFLELDPAGLFQEYVRVIETGEPVRTEYFFKEIATWFDVTAAKLGDGLVVSFSNVTPLKRAEKTQQRLADEYRHILDNALTAISHFTAVRADTADGRPGRIVDFRYESFNHMSELITGRRASEIVGRRMLELFPGVATSGVFDRWVQLVEGESQTTRFQDRYQLDGFDFWFDTQAVRWGDGFIQSYVDITPAKQAEQVQQQQAELFNQVINTSLNGILLLQPVRDETGQAHDFRVRLFNQAAHDLTGLPWNWSQTRTLLEMNASIGTSGLLGAAVRVLTTGEPLRVEFFFEPVSRWFDVAVARLDDELVVTFSDISAVRESVLERQRHAATQQALLDGSINAILACEAIRDEAGVVIDFNIVGGNRAVEVMLARPLGEVVGQTLLARYPGNVETGTFQRYKDTVETGQPQRFEVRYRADDLDTWFDISTVKSGDGLIISFLDVSEAKRAQQALLGESILFQTLSSHVPETGVLVVNPANRVVFANGELPEALLVPTDQQRLPQKRLGEVLRAAHRADVQAAFRRALAGEAQQTTAQFGEAFYDLFYGPVENAEGQVVMAMATFRNVTRDRLYAQQLKHSNENLERFAYVASHDLQEPLRKIQSFGDMLFRKQKDHLDEPALDLIRRMQASAERMNDLIRDLLTYSRVSSTPPEFRQLSLPKLLADVRGDLDLVIREKSATLHVDELPTVSGDDLQLRQLFQNLLSNALKFTRPDAPPAVDVRYRLVSGAETEAVLLLQPNARYHEISVSDNGIGFDEAYAERIFEAFQRLHGRGEYPGTGIGLAIVKKVVENHRGGLSVSSQVGEGSTFRVYLPVEEPN